MTHIAGQNRGPRASGISTASRSSMAALRCPPRCDVSKLSAASAAASRFASCFSTIRLLLLSEPPNPIDARIDVMARRPTCRTIRRDLYRHRTHDRYFPRPCDGMDSSNSNRGQASPMRQYAVWLCKSKATDSSIGGPKEAAHQRTVAAERSGSRCPRRIPRQAKSKRALPAFPRAVEAATRIIPDRAITIPVAARLARSHRLRGRARPSAPPPFERPHLQIAPAGRPA